MIGDVEIGWSAIDGLLSTFMLTDSASGITIAPVTWFYSFPQAHNNQLELRCSTGDGLERVLFRAGYAPNYSDNGDHGGATPTPAPQHTPFPYWTVPHHAQFMYTRSEIQLPTNRRLTPQERATWIEEYYDNGGASEFEVRMIAAINEVRKYYGLNPLAIAPPLMHASRFYAQTLTTMNLQLLSTVGPYGGSRPTASAFGASLFRDGNTAWSGGSGNRTGWSYSAILADWLRSPSHRAFILSPFNNYVGFGSHLGGRYGVVHYLLMSNNYRHVASPSQ